MQKTTRRKYRKDKVYTTFTPVKRMGQNFLTQDHVAARMAEAIAPAPGEVVLEIGPGYGALTKHLKQQGVRVFAVEYDQRLYEYLQQLEGEGEVEYIHQDILTFDPVVIAQKAGVEQMVLAGNLPYSISHKIVSWIIAYTRYFPRAFITLQKEVAKRLCTGPGTKDYCPLTIELGCYYSVKSVMNLPPNYFSPQPKVTSSFIRLDHRPDGLKGIKDSELFFTLVRAGFAHRRKMLRNNWLAGGLPVIQGNRAMLDQLEKKAGIDLSRRAESLDRDEFAALSNVLKEMAE